MFAIFFDFVAVVNIICSHFRHISDLIYVLYIILMRRVKKGALRFKLFLITVDGLLCSGQEFPKYVIAQPNACLAYALTQCMDWGYPVYLLEQQFSPWGCGPSTGPRMISRGSQGPKGP